MSGGILLALGVGLLPVLLFLLSLIALDSYKLVRLRAVLLAIVVGGVAAGAAYLLNGAVLETSELEFTIFSRYVAPPVEELLKGSIVVYLLTSHRVGFLVDAAIFGFAVGAGFALVENLYFLNLVGQASPATWIIRGFGTAIMHGGTTAILAIMAKTMGERRERIDAASVLPALLTATVVHGFFNHFFLTPVLSALLVLVLLPPLLLLVFQRSERALHEWLGTGFDADVQLLDLIHSGEFADSKPGRYLQSLTEHFPGEIVADMLCYLRLHLELAIRAKGELMMRESGFQSEIEPETRAKFEELRYLQNSIGATGRLAMKPFLDVRGRELWQLYLLERP